MKRSVGPMILLWTCTLLSACATGYQKMNIWDGLGYTDDKVADGVYHVTYLVNAYTPAQDALKYWHMRAREICGSDNYQYDVKQTVHKYDNFDFPYVIGTVTCKSKVLEDGSSTHFEFDPPPGFVATSKAPWFEEGILRFFGNKEGDNISVSIYGYLQNRELTSEVCQELVSSFNNSELRASVRASKASMAHHEVLDGVRSCYYLYEVQRQDKLVRVEYLVLQKTVLQSYAITAVYDTKSLDIDAIQRAMKSFRIK